MASGRPIGPPPLRLMLVLLAAGAFFAYWIQSAPRSARTTAPGATASVDTREVGRLDPGGHRSWGASVGFADSRRLEEHYEKHGSEFGHVTKLDYLHQAQLLRDATVGGPVLETVRQDGVATRFDRETGAFIAFNPDGTIRTFFKPNDGERYFRRQSERASE
jgi:hypothetical protein